MQRILTLAAGLLVLKVTISIVLKYGDYFPPSFESGFLQGRQQYFFGSYRWAFYPHIAAGPLSLVLGVLLISDRFRVRFPRWHRRLGRIQGLVVLFVVAPSGLWMAYRAEAGPVASVGFYILAVLTGLSMVLGWKAAVQRKFAEHRRWMWRCFLMLCSTVVLRLTAGVATVLNVQAPWIEVATAWASWIAPLAVFELIGPIRRFFISSVQYRQTQTAPLYPDRRAARCRH